MIMSFNLLKHLIRCFKSIFVTFFKQGYQSLWPAYLHKILSFLSTILLLFVLNTVAQAATAVNDSVVTAQDAPIVINVLENDLDNIDVIFSSDQGDQNSRCLGNSTGRFSHCQAVSVDASADFGVASGDLDGDGKEDVIFTSVEGNRLCLSDGQSGFSICKTVDVGTESTLLFERVLLKDLNQDNQLDIFLTDIMGVNNYYCLNTGESFSCRAVNMADNTTGEAVILGYINNDNELDTVLINGEGGPKLCLGYQDSSYDAAFDTTFKCNSINLDPYGRYNDVVLGYFNGDAALDIIFANEGQENSICFGRYDNNNFLFSDCSAIAAQALSSEAASLGDINNDSYLDVIFANNGQADQICLNDGLGGFSCRDAGYGVLKSQDILLTDTNQDGQLDILVATYQQGNFICLNQMDTFDCQPIGTQQLDTNGIVVNFLGLDISSLKIVTAPLQGQVVINAEGTVNYIPAAGFKGLDTFQYEIEGETATVTVMVQPVSIFSNLRLPLTMDLTVSLAGAGSGYVSSDPVGIVCTGEEETCVHTFDTQTWVTLTAVPDSGTKFVGWGNNAYCGDRFSLIRDTHCTAYFEWLPVDLTVTVQGHGRVTSEPEGLDCHDQCQQTFEKQTIVTLTPLADAGWQFERWAKDCDATGVVELGRDKHCQAVFSRIAAKTIPALQPAYFDLTVKIKGQGTVIDDQEKIACQPQCTAMYFAGAQPRLIATPAEYFYFAGWSEDCMGDDLETAVIMDRAKNCTAHFEQKHTLSIKQVGTGTGTLNIKQLNADGTTQPLPDIVTCQVDSRDARFTFCSSSEKLALQLAVIADDGSAFMGFEGDCDVAGSVLLEGYKDCIFEMVSTDVKRDKLFVTRMGQGTGTTAIKVVNNEGTLSDPDPSQVFCQPMGLHTTVCLKLAIPAMTFVVVPQAAVGSHFVAFGEACDMAGQVTLDGRDESCTVRFESAATLTVAIEGEGTVNSIPKGIYCLNNQGICHHAFSLGETIQLVIPPELDSVLSISTGEAAWTFDHWSGDCDDTGQVILNADKSCTAHFIQHSINDLQKLTITIEGQGEVHDLSNVVQCNSPQSPCDYLFELGTTVKLISNTDNDQPQNALNPWRFKQWGGECNSDGEVNMTAAKNCLAIFEEMPQFDLTVDVIGQGTVFVKTPEKKCASHNKTTCTYAFDENEMVAISVAEAVSGWHFDHFSGHCDTHGQVLMDDDRQCQAVFTCDGDGVGIDAQGNPIVNHSCFMGLIETKQGLRKNHATFGKREAESVTLSENILVDPEHLGKTADLYMILIHKTATTEETYMRVAAGAWLPWDQTLDNLLPAQADITLEDQWDVVITEEEDFGTAIFTEYTALVGYQLKENGHRFYNGHDPIHFFVDPDLLAQLVALTVLPKKNCVDVTWQTAAEKDSAGFYLWRALETGQALMRVSDLIASRGNPNTGTVYHYKDCTAVPGIPYIYGLEEMSLKNTSTFHLDFIQSVLW
jgi:hypothetical protein